MLALTADRIISHLNLVRHPEGGWYKEVYRSNEEIMASALPERFAGNRSFSTSIYFLLHKSEISAFHRIKSDELWHFHAGSTLTVHIITPDGEYKALQLGADCTNAISFQGVVPAGCWFGAEVTGSGDFALAGCTVAPGFDFTDFEMAERESLLKRFPAHQEIIIRLTTVAV